MENFILKVTKNYKAVIIMCLIVSAFMITQVTNLAVIVDVDKIMPQTHPIIVTAHKIEAIFGNKFTVAIGITANSGDIYQKNILAKIKGITDDLLLQPGVVTTRVNSLSMKKTKSINGIQDGMVVEQVMDNVPENDAEIAAMKKRVDSSPMYEGLLISKDKKTAQIVAEFKTVKGGFIEIEKSVRDVVNKYADDTVTIEVGGNPIFLSLLEKYSARMGFLFPLAVLLIGLIHYEAFRTLQALILPLVTSLMAVLWAMGIIGITKQPFDTFNAATPILILAIAAGHAVQILKRYYEEFNLLNVEKPGEDPKKLSREAVVSSLTKVGPVMIVACAVAAIGFFSLTVFEIKSVQTFGIFTGSGILSALILELTFIPALRTALKAPSLKETQREKEKTYWDKIVELAYNLSMNKRTLVYICSFIGIVVLSIGGYWVKADNSQKSYFYGVLQEKVDDSHLNQKMSGTNALFVLFKGKTEDSIKSPEVLKGIEAVQTFMAKEADVGKTISIVDFLKQMNKSMHADSAEFYKIPESKELIAQYLFLYSTSGSPEDFDAYVDTNYQNALLSVFVKDDHTAYATELVQKTLAYAKTQFGPDIEVGVGGGLAETAALAETMVHEKILNVAQIMLAVFVVASLVFKSPLAGILISVPLLAAVLVNFGIMGLLGIPLSIATALVSAMAVGIGADYGIYMSYRMREELRKGGDEAEALHRAFRSAGKATLFVSSAVAGGFGILMFSWGFWLHFYIGFLISLAMLVSSVTSLTLFPALIFSIRPRFIFENRQKK